MFDTCGYVISVKMVLVKPLSYIKLVKSVATIIIIDIYFKNML